MIDKEGNYRGTIAWGENTNSTIQKIIKLSNYQFSFILINNIT